VGVLLLLAVDSKWLVFEIRGDLGRFEERPSSRIYREITCSKQHEADNIIEIGIKSYSMLEQKHRSSNGSIEVEKLSEIIQEQHK
jgi:hypothetical protein